MGSAVVPNDASADTETGSDVPCVTAEPQQTNQKRRVALGLIAAAALMATGAAVTTTKPTSATQWAGAVSMAVTTNGMGCSDWETVKIGNLLNFNTLAECTAQCAANPGCTYSNYQPGGCSSDEDAEKGACYLFSSCDEEKNTCWDLTGPASGCSSTTSTTTPR